MNEDEAQKIIRFYNFSVGRGSRVAQFKLAQCYENGNFVSKDLQFAADLYLKSAEQNYYPAFAKCIELYLQHHITYDKIDSFFKNAMPRKMLCHAFEYFNILLFDGELAPLYLAIDSGSNNTNWTGAFFPRLNIIKINQYHIKTVLSLATLVHEMVHYWCFKYNKKKRKGIHDKLWKEKMRAVGLFPLGKYRKWSQKIIPTGQFSRACAQFLIWMDSVAENSNHCNAVDICCPHQKIDIGTLNGNHPCKDCFFAYLPQDVAYTGIYRDAFAEYCRTFLENNLFHAPRGEL